ncbi:MAG: ABC transporter ATP-binding protein [Chloroflexales bacterium]|nr:ABC transporter ATP-binding protein [Chloroflexales bacterium]
MDAVELENISKIYPTRGGPLAALDGVTLRVAEGETVALVGPSGCGKSTLLRLIADLDAPSAGAVRVLGMPPGQARDRRAYGLVFQAPTLFAWRTAAQNVALPLTLAGSPAPEREARVASLLRLVGLESFGAAYPRQLSGGMQQRVALARALALDPPLLLLDEPFAALDELTREQLQADLPAALAVTGRPISVVLVTHSLPEAVFLADRVAVFSARPGRILRQIVVDLPRPRTAELRDSARFHGLVSAARRALRYKDEG